MITFWEKQKIQRKEGWIASDSLLIPALRRTGYEKQRKTACFLGKRKQAVFHWPKTKEDSYGNKELQYPVSEWKS